jgi:hypothetical protein
VSIKKPTPLSNPKAVEAALDKFVNAAPGATAPAEPVGRYMKAGRPKTLAKKNPGDTVQIALKVSQADLDLIDAAADAQRVSRAAYIRIAVFGYMDTKA